jgi:predicted phage-related endonuclease
MVAPWFADRTGLTVAGEQARCTHRDDTWKLCTVDGFVLDGPNSDIGDALGVLEIKTTGDSAADWADEVPVHYRCQATWAMHVTDLPRCWFAVLHLAFGRPRFEVYEFERDAAEEAFVVDTCTRFWHDHVTTGHPPAVDGHSATTDAIKAHWPTAEGSLEVDALTRRMCDRIRAHKATAKLIEANIAEAENELRAALGDREALVDGTGKVLASWKPQSTARLDGKALKAARPDIAAEYTTTTTTRVLRVKNLEE